MCQKYLDVAEFGGSYAVHRFHPEEVRVVRHPLEGFGNRLRIEGEFGGWYKGGIVGLLQIVIIWYEYLQNVRSSIRNNVP